MVQVLTTGDENEEQLISVPVPGRSSPLVLFPVNSASIPGAPGGINGNVQYNNGGVLDGAANIIVVPDGLERALSLEFIQSALGASPSIGFARVGNNPGVIIGFVGFNGGNRAALRSVSDGLTFDDLILGDGTTSSLIYDILLQHLLFIGGNLEYILTATQFDLTGNGLVNIGTLDHDGAVAGFFGTAPAGRPTVTGSRGGNAALASLLTGLASLGLIVDNSTA